jgi:uncharacterized protein YbjT (DUF2867 family)
MTRILVTGGTGVLSRQLVDKLSQASHTLRVMSRRSKPATWPPGVEWVQADLESGQDLAEVVRGADAILHAATSPFKRTRAIDVDGTRRMLDAARSAGVAHFIYISIVGIDRIPFPYYRRKLEAEAVVTGGGVPWSILRATQFHDLLDRFLQSITRFPFAFLPTDFQFQLVDSGEVADRLVEAAAAGSSGRLDDMGGPEVLRLGDVARLWLAARGLKRRVFRLPLPGGYGHAMRHGYNTCPQNRQGKITWSEWLRKKYGVNG